MVERIARQPVAPEVTSRKRTIPFVYRPRIKKHQRRKTVINCLQPYPADTLANITLKRVLVTPCEDQIISLGFVSKQGTLTITVDRSVVQQLGEALIKAVEPSYVGAGIET